MDANRFDRLTRTLSVSASRRQGLAAVLAFALASARSARVSAAQDEPASDACEPGFTQCGALGDCVDLQSALDNCGACGAVCESELVPVECRGGECVRASCPVGVEYCGAVDGCRDLSSDPAHCGACGNACPSGVCSGGVCVSSGGACPEGELECDGECVATCCNNEHCGACGNACTPPFTCFEGVCDCPSGLCCAEGEVVCNGECVATCCDNANCGACGNACSPPLTCFEGVCDCPSGDCPPVKLPDTGVGVAGEAGAAAPWALLAAILTASKALATRRRDGTDAGAEGDPAASA